jgi:hypothetical protein
VLALNQFVLRATVHRGRVTNLRTVAPTGREKAKLDIMSGTHF